MVGKQQNEGSYAWILHKNDQEDYDEEYDDEDDDYNEDYDYDED